MGSKKSTKNERKAAKIYESAGYETWRPIDAPRRPQDIFDLFDMIAVPILGEGGEMDFGPSQVRFVQVKTNRAEGINAWVEEAQRFLSSSIRLDFLVRHDREGWRLLQPVKEEGEWTYVVRVDERDLDCNIGEELEEWLVNNGCGWETATE